MMRNIQILQILYAINQIVARDNKFVYKAFNYNGLV